MSQEEVDRLRRESNKIARRIDDLSEFEILCLLVPAVNNIDLDDLQDHTGRSTEDILTKRRAAKTKVQQQNLPLQDVIESTPTIDVSPNFGVWYWQSR